MQFLFFFNKIVFIIQKVWREHEIKYFSIFKKNFKQLTSNITDSFMINCLCFFLFVSGFKLVLN